MPEHSVDFAIRKRALRIGRADVQFTVKYGESVLGHCLISKGAIVWVLHGQQKGYRLSWKAFDEVMQKKGRLTKHMQI